MSIQKRQCRAWNLSSFAGYGRYFWPAHRGWCRCIDLSPWDTKTTSTISVIGFVYVDAVNNKKLAQLAEFVTMSRRVFCWNRKRGLVNRLGTFLSAERQLSGWYWMVETSLSCHPLSTAKAFVWAKRNLVVGTNQHLQVGTFELTANSGELCSHQWMATWGTYHGSIQIGQVGRFIIFCRCKIFEYRKCLAGSRFCWFWSATYYTNICERDANSGLILSRSVKRSCQQLRNAVVPWQLGFSEKSRRWSRLRVNLIALAACELYGIPPFQDHCVNSADAKCLLQNKSFTDAPITKQREVSIRKNSGNRWK